jgi:heme-degrading monooxygenase HmoA
MAQAVREHAVIIIGHTMFSVRRGTEHRAEAAIDEISGLLSKADGLRDFRVLRSVGMSPLASDLCSHGREAALCDAHYVVQTEWERIEDHDAFYAGEGLKRVYMTLASVLATGPYEILYESLVDQPAREGIAV